ncbi:hypothetical protein [Paramylibacter ulvae]|nr:hypothetical protein [Amylibacter ulvae]
MPKTDLNHEFDVAEVIPFMREYRVTPAHGDIAFNPLAHLAVFA